MYWIGYRKWGGKMKAYLYIITRNIRKRKVFSIVIVLLAFFAALFLVSAIGIIAKTQPLYENSYISSGESQLIYGFLTENFDSKIADCFYDNELVDDVYENNALLGILDVEDENIQTLFVQYNPNRNPYTVSEPQEFDFELKANEILVPMDFKNSYGYQIGSIITYKGTEFCISGFYEDPICGSPFYHTKRILISTNMYMELSEYVSEKELHDITFLNIGVKSSDRKALKENIKELEAGFPEADNCIFSFNQPRLTTARTMVPRIILAVLALFSFFLLGIMFLVIRYVILAAIEEDYTSLGIMKAIGFKGYNLTILLLFQYLLIVMFGFALGVAGAYIVTPFIGVYLLATSGISWIGNINAVLTIGITVTFALFVSMVVYSQTRKVKRIKPIEVIVLGRQKGKSKYNRIRIYSKPFCEVPISARMGIKQLFSNLGQYVTLLFLVAIFTFMMINIAGLSNAFSSADSIASILGYDVNDIKITVSEESGMPRERVDLLIEQINEKYGVSYYSVYETGYDGYVENSAVQLLVYSYFQTSNIISGTCPKKSDEIMISSGISEEFEKNIGDTLSISLSRDGTPFSYKIVGINNQVYDMGRNITLSENGIRELEPSFVADTFLIKIDDNGNIPETIKNIEQNILPGESGITLTNERVVIMKRVEAIKTTLSGIATGVTIISIILIAAITFLVSIVVAWRETVYGGILKAIGFTPNQLRIQFASRFILITILGSFIGILGSVILDGRLINLLFRLVNIAGINSGVTIRVLIVNIIFIVLSASVSAWWVSRRMKKLNVRLLLSE